YESALPLRQREGKRGGDDDQEPAAMKPARFWNTVRFLRPRQVVARLVYGLYRPRLRTANVPKRREPRGVLAEPYRRPPSMVDHDSFVFLNQAGEVKTADDWNSVPRDKLWLYNLHYFDDLNALDASARMDWPRSLISRWIAHNPPTEGNGL